jgi:alpha-amylase
VARSDFPTARWQVLEAPPGSTEQVLLGRSGWVDWKRVEAQKSYAVRGERSLIVRWRFVASEPIGPLWFAPELALTLLDGHSEERCYEVPGRDLSPKDRVLGSMGAFDAVETLALANHANRFRVTLYFESGGAPARPTVWRFPIETVSMSEGGFERIYQGSVIAPLLPVHLGPEPFEAAIRITIDDL